MKKLLAMLMILALLPMTALAGADAPLTYERQAKKFIDFPTLDGWRGHFSSVTKWTIVTPETLEENWELVAARGDKEEEIRARYAAPTFLFEAYSPDLPKDACFRAEVFETEATREIWHLRHWNSAERKEIRNYAMSGRLLQDREVYSLTNQQTNLHAYEQGYFTNYPPAAHESGKIRLHFYNGKLYVFSYAVSGRLAGAARWYTAKELEAYRKTPVDSPESKFTAEALPRMPQFELTSAMPEIVMPGELTVTGTVETGAKISAALDDEELSVKLDKKGAFSVKVPLKEAGERVITFTVERAKYTTRVMEYPVTVTETQTPLTITQEPDQVSNIGSIRFAGWTEAGAEIAVAVDSGEPARVTAGQDGSFSYSFQADERRSYEVQLTAKADGKTETVRAFTFAADYEDTEDGIKAFNEEVTDVNFKTIAENVDDYIGTKVKISIRTKEITLNEQGLGILCVYNAKKEKDQTPLYVNLPGYAQCQLGEKMVITIYATVDGKRTTLDKKGNEVERIELTADYGTYLVAK
nr:hypothetical protein [Clostridia bacterium]